MREGNFCASCCQRDKKFSRPNQDFCDDCLATELDRLDGFLKGMFGEGLSEEAYALYLANSALRETKETV